MPAKRTIKEDNNYQRKLKKENNIRFSSNNHSQGLFNRKKNGKEEYADVPADMLNNSLMDTLSKKSENEARNKLNAKKNAKKEKRYSTNAINGKKTPLSRIAKNSKYKKNIIDLLGYKTLTHDDNHYLVLSDEDNNTSGLAEIFRVGGAGIGGLSETMKEKIATGFIKFLQMNPDDVEFISLPIPNSTKRQQIKWEQMLNKLQIELANNEYKGNAKDQRIKRIKYIKDSLLNIKNVEVTLINQGFFMIIYQDIVSSNADLETGEIQSVFKQTNIELGKKVNNALILDKHSQSLNLSRMNAIEKEKILHRLNNPRAVF